MLQFKDKIEFSCRRFCTFYFQEYFTLEAHLIVLYLHRHYFWIEWDNAPPQPPSPEQSQPDSHHHHRCYGCISKSDFEARKMETGPETERSGESCFTLFQDIIEPIWVCTHSEVQICAISTCLVKVQIGNVLRISLNMDCKKKKKKSSWWFYVFAFSAFSATSRN